MKAIAINFILIIAIIYFIVGIIIFFSQRKMLYFPTPEISNKYARIILSNDFEKIKVIVLNDNKENAILYFGGNGEAVLGNANSFIETFPDHTVYLMNYRGYGGSSGSPTEKGIYSDSLALFDKVASKHPRITIIGRSLGTGVATFVAVKRKIAKLILITPFDSIEKVANRQFFMYPLSLMLLDKYDSASRVKDINVKTLIMVAKNDNIISFINTENLIKKFPHKQVEIYIIEGVDHNSISFSRKYYRILNEFIYKK